MTVSMISIKRQRFCKQFINTTQLSVRRVRLTRIELLIGLSSDLGKFVTYCSSWISRDGGRRTSNQNKCHEQLEHEHHLAIELFVPVFESSVKRSLHKSLQPANLKIQIQFGSGNSTMKVEVAWSDRVPERDSIKPCVYDMCYRPDGAQLVVAVGNRVLIYDANDGDLVHSLKGHKDTVRFENAPLLKSTLTLLPCTKTCFF
jgi:hypothetical protein